MDKVRLNLAIPKPFSVTCLIFFFDKHRYVDRLKDDLKQTLTLADKMTFHEKEMLVKCQESKDEQAEIQPKLDLIIKKTKEMQKQVYI